MLIVDQHIQFLCLEPSKPNRPIIIMILLPTLKFIINHHLFPRWPTDPTSPTFARELELAEYWPFVDHYCRLERGAPPRPLCFQ